MCAQFSQWGAQNMYTGASCVLQLWILVATALVTMPCLQRFQVPPRTRQIGLSVSTGNVADQIISAPDDPRLRLPSRQSTARITKTRSNRNHRRRWRARPTCRSFPVSDLQRLIWCGVTTQQTRSQLLPRHHVLSMSFITHHHPRHLYN